MSDGPRRASARGATDALLAVALALAFLVAGVGTSGIWDPYELDNADAARRIAIHLFGADELALEEAASSMPTLSDLGKGELGHTSMAAGLWLFGLTDYGGRLPLALWALLGALALYLFLHRFVAPRAGLYAVVALVTMPLYFVQARTMLGDAVSMAAFTMCVCGLAGAMLDAASTSRALGWFTMGAVGAVSGYLARGAVLGLAAPVGAVGLTWLLTVLAPRRGEAVWAQADVVASVRRHAVGGVALLGAGLAAYAGARAIDLQIGEPGDVRRVIGAAVLSSPPTEATFDLAWRDLGHALFPWSALLPLLLGTQLGARGNAVAASSTTVARVVLVVGAAVALLAHGATAPYLGGVVFLAPALLAGLVGIALADFEASERGSVPVALGVTLLGAVLLVDFRTLPDKGLAAFGVDADAKVPEAFVPEATGLLQLAGAVFFGVVALAFGGPHPPHPAEGAPGVGHVAAARLWLDGRRDSYRSALRALARLHRGNLAFGFLVAEAALIGLGAMIVIGRRLEWSRVMGLSHGLARLGLNLWWALPLALALAVPLLDASRAAVSAVARVARLSRAALVAVAGIVAGGILCFGYYPALGARLSPKEVFATYRRARGPGEPLAVLGLRARVARFYARGGDVESLASPRAALRWLLAEGDEPPGVSTDAAAADAPRRWLALRDASLAELSSLYRARTGDNLPVIEGSGDILLASSRLEGATNVSWLEAHVRDAPPAGIQHPLEVKLEKLDALGWEIALPSGERVEHVVPGKPYRMRFFYRVREPIGRSYQAFIHIDGYGRRHNGDHPLLGDRYRLSLWLPGDVIVDDYELVLEPHFLAGRYAVYFGLFAGKHRMKVLEGTHHDDRVQGGALLVR